MRAITIKPKSALLVFVIAIIIASLPLLAITSTASAEIEKSDTEEGTIVLTNGIYELSVEDIIGAPDFGTFTVSTGAAHPNPGQNVLYGGANNAPWSTYLTVRDYTTQTDYVSAEIAGGISSDYNLVSLNTFPQIIFPSIPDPNSVTVQWLVPGGLLVEQVTAIEGSTLADSRVRVTTTVSNSDVVEHQIGIRYEWDLMIAGSDDALFTQRNPDTGFSPAEVYLPSPGFELFETTDEFNTFSVYGSVNGPVALSPTPPDLFVYGNWGSCYSNAFTYTQTGSSDVGDSAVLYYWGDNPGNALQLAPAGSPSDSQSVTQYLYATTSANVPPSTNPVEVTDLTNPNPTISWSYFDANGDPQQQYQVWVWTDSGLTGACCWNDGAIVGADSSVVYGGDALVPGDTYYASVRAFDGEDWGEWSETSFQVEDQGPVEAVPSISDIGIISLIGVIVASGVWLLRKKDHTLPESIS